MLAVVVVLELVVLAAVDISILFDVVKNSVFCRVFDVDFGLMYSVL